MKKVYLLLLLCIASIAGYSQTLITYSQAFTSGVAPTTQCTAWDAYRATLPATNVYSFTIFGSNDLVGKTCTNPVMAQAIANALRTGTSFGPTFDATSGQTWVVFVGGCTGSNCSGSASVELTGTGIGCGCATGYTLRPNINNSNWGGINTTTCSAPTQTMSLTFRVYSYDNGSPQSLTMCQNSPAVSISNLLKVSGGNGTNTWTVTVLPLHGSLAGFPATAPTGVSSLPAGVNYTPTPGYNGTDAFTIQASDGVNTVTTTINVTVNPLPAVSAGSNVTICNGSSTTLSATGGGGTFTWSPATGLSATTGAVVIASPTTATTYTVTRTNLNGCSNTSSVTVSVNPIPSLTLGAMPEVCAGVTSANLTFSGVSNAISKTTSLGFTGGMQTWTVPAGVTSIMVDAIGANGGLNSNGVTFDAAGMGGRVQATLAVTPGQVLNIFVGGQGSNGTPTVAGTGGFNGGGAGNNFGGTFSGGGGGGATDIRIGGIALGDRVLVAGAGGGAGLDCGGNLEDGGAGGGLTGADGLGIGCDNGQGFGGTPSAGGAAGFCACLGSAGTAGGLGFGGNGGLGTAGGGGGAGLYGGGGAQWNGAGGGSSYTDAILATAVTHTQGFNTTGDGSITITYLIPTTYSILWDVPASTAGFTDVINNSVTTSPIAIAVPGAAPANVYTGHFTMTNGFTGCSSISDIVSVTVKPIPDVSAVGNQVVCNGASTSAITFTGSLTGTSFNWTNSDATIGLPASGSGNIPSFTATNTSNIPVIATVNVTPSLNGCTGTPVSFTFTVNPTPDVNPSSNQTLCNGVLTAAVNFTGSVSGTTFTWSNSNTAIGLGSAGTGNIAAFTATNSGTAPISSVITVNTTANGCTGISNSFTIGVNPTPVFTSSLNPTPICDNTLFSYVPTSATTGTSFNWSRAVVTGISNTAASGSNNPLEILHNTTAGNVTAIYVYTLTANACSNTQSVNAVVKPTPVLTSGLTPAAICDSTMFVYGPASATTGTTFTWSRALVSGIANPAASGADTIREILWNSTPNPITVTYKDTLKANGCMNVQTITVAVNPRPVLSTPLTISPICDGSGASYVAGSGTTGTTFSWSRATVAGITEPANSGTGNSVSEILHNTTANPVVVTYNFTLTANGCSYTQPVLLTVNPTPMLSSTLTPTGLCNGSLFNYPVTSATVGSAFSWNRPYVTGIGQPAGTGTGNPNEILTNNTNFNITVNYVYTVTANGCSNSQTVSVVVHPTPTLSSAASKAICSGEDVNYNPTGFVFGSTFTWSRAHVNGITPSTGSGTGTVHENLADSALVPFAVVYTFTVTANGCSNVQTVTVTVNPTAPSLPITTHSPSTVCANTLYQNFGTNIAPPIGQNYHWEAQNATVWATGTKGQYALVNFKTPGYSRVILKSNVTGFSGCITNNYFDVNVNSSVSTIPNVVYFDGQLICLTTDEDNYQWGFDDAATLDSTVITGENNPNYFISGPDFTHRRYWVITNKNGCMEKTYYNAPVGITDINADETSVKVYPNPTKEMLNVVINTAIGGNYTIEVVNMVGQKMISTIAENQKASLNVASFATGVYMVDCYRDGAKVGSVRFVKN